MSGLKYRKLVLFVTRKSLEVGKSGPCAPKRAKKAADWTR